MDLYDQVMGAAAAIQERSGAERHDVAVVLGSGLGPLVERRPNSVVMDYGELPGFPIPQAMGHAGRAYSVEAGAHRVLLLSGRAHAYEGHDMATMTLPVRAAVAAGCHTVILTNAAGAIPGWLQPGDLVVIRDHINLAARNPLVGPNDERLGPRFPDMTDVYSPRLRYLARRVAAEDGTEMQEVVYAWWLGPSFETPAEIGMIAALGGDVVGMSTVPEAIAARHMGAEVVGFSLVTNRAAGLSDGRLSSEEVMEVATRARPRIEAFMDRFLAHTDLGAGPES